MSKNLVLSIAILFAIFSMNILYARTAKNAVLVTQECKDNPTMFRKIITEFDENNVRIRRTTIVCDGSVYVQNYNEKGEPIFDLLVGTIALNGEEYHTFSTTQIGITLTSWNLKGFDISDNMIYHIAMINDDVQILFPPPPPTIDIKSINGTTDDKEIDPRMLTIYPSPANDYITLKLNSNYNNSIDLTNCSIVIGSIEGKIVYTQKLIDLSANKEFTLDISKLPVGSYGISVNIGNKNSIGTSFVKK